MRHPRTQHVVRVLAAAMLASFALRADAQEKPAEPKPQESKQAETKPAPPKPAEAKPAEAKPAEAKPAPEKPEITLPQLGGGDGGKEEMIKLFHEVEQKLQEVDRLLYDAGAGTAVGGELADSGIDRLLRDAQARSSSAQQGIDRILELARQQQQQQSSSSGGTGSEQQPQGDSPLDEPRRQGEQQREKKPGGKAPDSQGKPEQPQPTGEPKSPITYAVWSMGPGLDSTKLPRWEDGSIDEAHFPLPRRYWLTNDGWPAGLITHFRTRTGLTYMSP